MTEEILNAAIMRLRAKALEHYGVLKDLYRRPADKDTVDKLCQHAVALVEFEGAMLTLQQYSGAIKADASPEETPKTTDTAVSPDAIRGEELSKRSPTYRRSQKKQGKKKDE